MSQDQKQTKKNNVQDFLHKRKTWIIGGILIFLLIVISIIFHSSFRTFSEYLITLFSEFKREFFREEYRATFWLIEIGLFFGLLFFFIFWKNFTITIERLIKIVGCLGVILLIHFIFADFSFLTFIDGIFKNLKLDGSKGYVVGGMLVFTAILWGCQILNERFAVFQSQKLEDRFIRSVELTGNRDIAIRLGGLAGLQDLSHENVQMYRRVWGYFGTLLRNPPELEGWESFSEVRKIGRSRIKKEMLFCRRIVNQETPSTQDTLSDQNKERIIGRRPDIAHIAKILREQHEQQRKWKKEENVSLPLNEVRLEGANLYKVRLERADLSSARLEGTKLWHARLEGAKLWRARLEGAALIDAKLDGANLSHAQMEEAKLWHARLEGADLSHARLEGADLIDARLDSTDLTATDLSKALNLIPQQIIGKKCRYRKDKPPLLPEEWSQEQREQVLASMKVYG